MLKQRLQQKLLQKLSPQQIQMIKLLEVPTIQLEQRIKKELEENPALEEGAEDEYEMGADAEESRENSNDKDHEEFTLEDYIEDDEIPSYRLNTTNYSRDDKREEIPFSVGSTFHDHLEKHIGLRYLNEKEQFLASYII